jgi:hypothetical protein
LEGTVIYTPELGAGVGDPLPSLFVRGVASFDPDVVPASFEGFGFSATGDLFLVSGSATRVSDGNVYEFGATTPSLAINAGVGYGISIPGAVRSLLGSEDSGATDGVVARVASSYPSEGNPTVIGAYEK